MSKNYSGCSLVELCKGEEVGNFYIPPIEPSKYHTVLFELPIDYTTDAPKPHINKEPKHWDDEYVRMPFSPKNLFPVKTKEGEDILKPRWEIICEAFEKPISNISELENALNSYNTQLIKLINLEYFFENELIEEESIEFFNNLLPKIIQLALRLPEVLPGGIPLLKKYFNKSISMSQLQISSLLANAFLCTFPWRKDVSATYPGVNFVRLFSINNKPKRTKCLMGKLKCILHYFHRVTTSEPIGVVTFQRISLKRNQLPKWDKLENNLSNTKVHISSTGTIEDTKIGFLQVDFANKNIGGGVLGYGSVQEEIRFVICPELIISRLFVEQLGDTEAVIIRGVERFSQYTGYSDSFEWSGNYVDTTPFDNYKRRKTAISVIDATRFNKSDTQYYPNALLRELGKAYAGFYSHHTDNLAPVATGNWGCGAFQGDPQLKTLIQLMACSAAHRDLVYYTFGDKDLQDSFYSMYLLITTNGLKIYELWRIICQFSAKKLPSNQFNSFIQQCCFDKQNQIKIESEKKISEEKPTTSKSTVEIPKKQDEIKVISNSPSSDEDIIFSSQPESSSSDLKQMSAKSQFNKEFFEKNHNEILDIFKKLDKSSSDDSIKRPYKKERLTSGCSEEDSKETSNGEKMSMEISENIEEIPPKINLKSKNKITNYFSSFKES